MQWDCNQGRRGHGQGVMAPKLFPNRRIFKIFKVSFENFQIFTVGKDKGFGFYRKIFEHAPTYSSGATMPLSVNLVLEANHSEYFKMFERFGEFKSQRFSRCYDFLDFLNTF